MGGNQLPVDCISEKSVDIPVADGFVWAVDDGVADAAHAAHQLDSNDPAKVEDRLTLSLDIGVERVRLDNGRRSPQRILCGDLVTVLPALHTLSSKRCVT